jgi:HTH-type transcriptional regulator/antitoxin HigA
MEGHLMTLSIEKSRYQELIDEFPLRPLRSKAAYKCAMAAADRLAVQDEKSLTADERDYLETLSLLIESYEAQHDVMDFSGLRPADVLRHLMEEREMTVSSLGKVIGSKGVASELLSGKRELSKSHVMTLAKHFAVEPSVFLPSI